MLASLADLDEFVAGGEIASFPPNVRSLYSPVDDVHGALVKLLESATVSLSIGMYGFDDAELADVIKAKLADPGVTVELSLDSVQAGGVAERKLLAEEAYPASSIAVGRSERGAIMHLKEVVIDGTDVVSGSTNWSESGESLQDNVLWVFRSPFLAARSAARLSMIHMHMLQGKK